MQITVLSSRTAAAKTFVILPWQIASFIMGFFLLALMISIFFSWLGVYFDLPFIQRMVVTSQEDHNQKMEEYTRDNIKSMAVRLGEMRAQLIRLDLLGERISKTSGIPFTKNDALPQVIQSDSEPKNAVGNDHQGGPLVRLPQSGVLAGLQHDLDRLSEAIAQQSDSLIMIESQLTERKIKTGLLPTIVPINARAGSSPFGIRVDPIDGGQAMHEGIDFSAETGTPVIASAGGIVTTASYHSQYGNLVEINHGNDFSSRYAHMSRIDVKLGQIVKREQQVGLSGNTGRTTGPHLHFEVRFKGVAQNPARFFKMGKSDANGILTPGQLPENLIKPSVKLASAAAKPRSAKPIAPATTPAAPSADAVAALGAPSVVPSANAARPIPPGTATPGAALP